jgi:hypothetical protein
LKLGIKISEATVSKYSSFGIQQVAIGNRGCATAQVLAAGFIRLSIDLAVPSDRLLGWPVFGAPVIGAPVFGVVARPARQSERVQALRGGDSRQ